MGGGAKKEHESFDVSPTTATATLDPPITPAQWVESVSSPYVGGDGVVGGGGAWAPSSWQEWQGAVEEALEAPESGAVMVVGMPEVDEPEGVVETTANIELQELNDNLDELLGDLDASLLEKYEFLGAYTKSAQSVIDTAQGGGADSGWTAAQHVAVKAKTKGVLGGLDTNQLQALAGSQGFAHPTLVGPSTETKQSGLVHWLDPAYPDLPSKAKIQAKAVQRYDELAAGVVDSHLGQTLAEVQAAEALLAGEPEVPEPELPEGAWVATAAEVTELRDQGLAAAQYLLDKSAYYYLSSNKDELSKNLTTLMETENQLVTAQCPEDPDLAGLSAAQVVQELNKVLLKPGYQLRPITSQVVETGVAEGKVPAEYGALSFQDAIAVIRASTPEDKRAELVAKAAERAGWLAELEAKRAAAVQAFPALSGTLATEGGRQAFAAAVEAGRVFREDYGDKYNYGKPFNDHPSVAPSALGVESGSHQVGLLIPHVQTWRDWAKTQKMNDLRDTAAQMGLADPEKALTRADIQNWLLLKAGASPNWKISASDIEAKAAGGKAAAKEAAEAKKASKAQYYTASTWSHAPQPASSPLSYPSTPAPTPTITPSVAAPTSSWTAKVAVSAGVMKVHGAALADVPDRRPQVEVNAMGFVSAPSPNPGGAHSKSMLAAEDNSVWMFKPDKSAGGARATAEATASEVFERVGVAAVPVYRSEHGGQPGCIQPMVSGVTDLKGTPPSGLTQGEVDTIVKAGVAHWMMGDHDSNPDNWLRTPSGGLVPCDQGQAFKFYGSDRLGLDYAPNTSFGATPMIHQVLNAQKSGDLAEGVRVRPEAAAPVLKAFADMPDESWREMLRPVATEGSKNTQVGWNQTMRNRAAQQSGKAVSQVTEAEVAEAFLDHAVERKQALRQDYGSFLGESGVDTSILDLV